MDTGPIILQEAVSVFDDDTEESLHERIHQVEHRLYPKAIQLFIEQKLRLEGRRCMALKSRKALISVSNKAGVVIFAQELAMMGWEIVSTEGLPVLCGRLVLT